MKLKKIFGIAAAVCVCVAALSVTVFAGGGRGEAPRQHICGAACVDSCPASCGVNGILQNGMQFARASGAATATQQNVRASSIVASCPLYKACGVEGCAQTGAHEHNSVMYCGGTSGQCGGQLCGQGAQHNGVGGAGRHHEAGAQNGAGGAGVHHGAGEQNSGGHRGSGQEGRRGHHG